MKQKEAKNYFYETKMCKHLEMPQVPHTPTHKVTEYNYEQQ